MFMECTRKYIACMNYQVNRTSPLCAFGTLLKSAMLAAAVDGYANSDLKKSCLNTVCQVDRQYFGYEGCGTTDYNYNRYILVVIHSFFASFARDLLLLDRIRNPYAEAVSWTSVPLSSSINQHRQFDRSPREQCFCVGNCSLLLDEDICP
jgi:hypothetical protein